VRFSDDAILAVLAEPARAIGYGIVSGVLLGLYLTA